MKTFVCKTSLKNDNGSNCYDILHFATPRTVCNWPSAQPISTYIVMIFNTAELTDSLNS